jgi:hypothetical protein
MAAPCVTGVSTRLAYFFSSFSLQQSLPHVLPLSEQQALQLSPQHFLQVSPANATEPSETMATVRSDRMVFMILDSDDVEMPALSDGICPQATDAAVRDGRIRYADIHRCPPRYKGRIARITRGVPDGSK